MCPRPPTAVGNFLTLPFFVTDDKCVAFNLKWDSDFLYCAIAYAIFIPFLAMKSAGSIGATHGPAQPVNGTLEDNKTRSEKQQVHVNRSNSTLVKIYRWLTLSFILRVIWAVGKASDFMSDDERVIQSASNGCDSCLACSHAFIMRLVNRFSVLSFFTAFSIVAMFWLDVGAQTEAAWLKMKGGKRSHDNHDAREEGCCKPQVFILIVNFWVYLIELVVEAFYWQVSFPEETFDRIKDWNYLAVSSFYIFLGFVLVYAGLKLRRMLAVVRKKRNGNKKRSGANERQVQCKIVLVMAITFVSFCLRGFVFLARPLLCMGNIWGYPYLWYPVPDLFPTMVFIVLTLPPSYFSKCCTNATTSERSHSTKRSTSHDAELLAKLADGFEWDATHMWMGGSPRRPLLHDDSAGSMALGEVEDSAEDEILYL